mmetsp:Transcript_6420/g.15908  ORF Transcript_6420/g.15908 Transcript_6420/m.15908 type:complete len:243 (+) Transcript_6420:68-796(+)
MIFENCNLLRQSPAGRLVGLLPHRLIHRPNGLGQSRVPVLEPQHRPANPRDFRGAGASQDPIVRPTIKIASLGFHRSHDLPRSLGPLVANARLEEVVENVNVRRHTVLVRHLFNKTEGFFQLPRSRKQLHAHTQGDLSRPNFSSAHIAQQPNPNIEGSLCGAQRPAAAVKQYVVRAIICKIPHLVKHRQCLGYLAGVAETFDDDVVRHDVTFDTLLAHPGQESRSHFHLSCTCSTINHDVVS